jgi:hypothetical protein
MYQDFNEIKRNKKLKGFLSNFASWVIVCTFLFILNAINYEGEWWAIYPLLGWGVGIAFHALSVFKHFAFEQIDRHAENTRQAEVPRRELPQSDWQPMNENKTKEKARNYDDSEFV